jgi:hypothetical protein
MNSVKNRLLTCWRLAGSLQIGFCEEKRYKDMDGR